MTATSPRFDFASDNTAGCAPEALQSLIEANSGFTSGYGTDNVTSKAADLVRDSISEVDLDDVLRAFRGG